MSTENKTTTLANDESAWVNPYLASLSKQTPGIEFSIKGGVIVKDGTTDEQVSKALKNLITIRRKNSRVATMIDRFVGQLILHYSAVHNTDWTTAISQLDLTEHTGKAFKTLMKLPRIVSQLPDEAFELPNISTQHLDAATSFAGPDDPDERVRFGERRLDVLRKVNEDPSEFNKAWVSAAMREIQKEFGIAPSRPPSAKTVLDNLVRCSLILQDFEDEDYEAFGITKEETQEKFAEYRELAADRNLIPDTVTNPTAFCPPWKVQQQVIDVEATENETRDIPANQENVGGPDGHDEADVRGQDTETVHPPEQGGEGTGEENPEPQTEETEG